MDLDCILACNLSMLCDVLPRKTRVSSHPRLAWYLVLQLRTASGNNSIPLFRKSPVTAYTDVFLL